MDEETPSREKSLGRKVIEWLLVFAVLCILLSIPFPVGSRSRESARRSSCQSNLKQIMLSVRQYAADYDAKLPLVSVETRADFKQEPYISTFGWADALSPYSRSLTIFQCPSERVPPTQNQLPQTSTEGAENQNVAELPPDETPLQVQYTDYWFNALASGAGEKQISEPTQTILLGDGNDGTDVTNARYHLAAIPLRWHEDQKSPLYRHLDGSNFAFVDGHTKWVKADRWNNSMDSTAGYTFRLQPVIKAVHK